MIRDQAVDASRIPPGAAIHEQGSGQQGQGPENRPARYLGFGHEGAGDPGRDHCDVQVTQMVRHQKKGRRGREPMDPYLDIEDAEDS